MTDPASSGRRIVALGECMVELRDEPGFMVRYAFAGDTLNVATYLRRLLPAPDFRVDYATAVGDDPLSEQMTEVWREEGIGTDLVRRLPGALPGLYWIRNRADGDREFFYWRNASAARQMFRDGEPDPAAYLHAALQNGDLLYLSGISLAILPASHRDTLLDGLSALRGRGISIAYDSNYRARLWASPEEAAGVYHRMLENADVFITSTPDEQAVFGARAIEEAVERLTAGNVPEWVLRDGPGITVTGSGGRVAAKPVDPATVVDTTGAGDSFDAAYLSARLQGYDSAAAVAAGHALAGVVVQNRGAIIPASATPAFPALVGGR